MRFRNPKQQKIQRDNGYDYLLYLPGDYEKLADWPLILFLHGAGERGSDLDELKRHGIPRIVEESANFPFIAVSPQCPLGQYWRSQPLTEILEEVISMYKVDEGRIYLTGISMGGYGAWQLAIDQPQRFAAIAPICGGGNPSLVCRIKDLPVWNFHGAKDWIVPITESQRMVNALEKCGGDVKFTIYPEAEHDSWTQTYKNPELYGWFLRHRRNGAGS